MWPLSGRSYCWGIGIWDAVASKTASGELFLGAYLRLPSRSLSRPGTDYLSHRSSTFTEKIPEYDEVEEEEDRPMEGPVED